VSGYHELNDAATAAYAAWYEGRCKPGEEKRRATYDKLQDAADEARELERDTLYPRPDISARNFAVNHDCIEYEPRRQISIGAACALGYTIYESDGRFKATCVGWPGGSV